MRYVCVLYYRTVSDSNDYEVFNINDINVHIYKVLESVICSVLSSIRYLMLKY